MTTIIHPFPIIDLAGNIIKNIDIPFTMDCEIQKLPDEDGLLMTEEGTAAVREARINLLKGTFWLVEYEARECVVEVFALPPLKIKAKKTSGSPRGEGFPLGMGFFAPGQDSLWPVSHAKWIRQVYPTPPAPAPALQSPLAAENRRISTLMRTHKLRVWDSNEKRFQLFDLHNITVSDRLLSQDKYPVQPFIGLLDKNMKPIYEGDVVQGLSNEEKKPLGGKNLEVKGEVRYSSDLCAYVVDWYHLFSQIETSSLEILGNMMENYIYDETGQLKRHIG